MHINKVSPQTGYLRIRQGFWLFKQKPYTFLMLVFLYIFVVQLSMFLPIIGFILILVLSPVFSVGFLTACQKVIRKERVAPSVYISPLRELPSGVRKNLLKLGLIYTLLILMLSVISSQFVDVEKLVPLLTATQISAPDVLKEFYQAIVIGGILYIPISLLMWFSPQLVAWKGMTIAKALFGSIVACWMNRWAFMVYFCIWGLILVAIPLFLGAFFEAMNLSSVASYLISPITMAALTVLYCSFFATWKSCFVDSSDIQAPTISAVA